MIAYLSGKIIRKSSNHLVLSTGGVGYKVMMNHSTLHCLPEAGSDLQLEIYTVVRENEITLYGFCEAVECRLFEILLGATGVGPKLALNILDQCPWQELVCALQEEDVARIRAIKGIGEKTAKILAVGLKNKVKEFSTLMVKDGVSSRGQAMQLAQAAEAALVNLGYSRNEIQRTLSSMSIVSDSTLQDIIKESLRALSKQPVAMQPTNTLK
jgi:Holliday junction DNA helicase RuvA